MKSSLDNKYQLYIILNTYDLIDHQAHVRAILADAWGMKLRGYRHYFPYGVLPMDQYDFISHHIVAVDKTTEKSVMAVRIVTNKSCQKFGLEFPAKEKLLHGKEKEYPEHACAIENWLLENFSKEIAYSSSFTIDPLIEKDERRNLRDALFAIFPLFYTSYQIPHIIHGVNRNAKLTTSQENLGFKSLELNKEKLCPVRLDWLDDIECEIMVLEDYQFSADIIDESKKVVTLWENRIEYIGMNDANQKKIAA